MKILTIVRIIIVSILTYSICYGIYILLFNGKVPPETEISYYLAALGVLIILGLGIGIALALSIALFVGIIWFIVWVWSGDNIFNP